MELAAVQNDVWSVFSTSSSPEYSDFLFFGISVTDEAHRTVIPSSPTSCCVVKTDRDHHAQLLTQWPSLPSASLTRLLDNESFRTAVIPTRPPSRRPLLRRASPSSLPPPSFPLVAVTARLVFRCSTDTQTQSPVVWWEQTTNEDHPTNQIPF